MLNSASTPLVTMLASDSYQLIAADLRSLIARIEISMRLIDAAMSHDDNRDAAGSTDVFVLDDITPRYATASAALNACRAELSEALQCLSESGGPAEIAVSATDLPHLTAE
ncbi:MULTISPECIES: hypothetical protein [unclassified Bradyrhizobium]|uniref:hypothetical protein n=1 Tax=unclassified Bradyrhizobium TaxID=2631580 RepID=UPI002479C9BA|nr:MULTISPECIES: hypothetical protein [unclassified Bradyrhizobium]WGR71794.1 hypothetical protein MTX24_02150 [Bradyrhizobium sp. ISRA426]WGR76629.1 hypothetical protein MTX21_27100 [Bradyrhizobium sp. ISRA430]WGR87034.1 hypothetical protein MTX25_02150 [Bradyrhizobium sp. ISRA432]